MPKKSKATPRSLAVQVVLLPGNKGFGFADIPSTATVATAASDEHGSSTYIHMYMY